MLTTKCRWTPLMKHLFTKDTQRRPLIRRMFPVRLNCRTKNSYDRLQVILTRVIDPPRDAVRVKACMEAEVRTPA